MFDDNSDDELQLALAVSLSEIAAAAPPPAVVAPEDDAVLLIEASPAKPAAAPPTKAKGRMAGSADKMDLHAGPESQGAEQPSEEEEEVKPKKRVCVRRSRAPSRLAGAPVQGRHGRRSEEGAEGRQCQARCARAAAACRACTAGGEARCGARQAAASRASRDRSAAFANRAPRAVRV